MTLSSLSWPEAVVAAVSVATAGLVLAVLIWSIFRTGRAAIAHDRE